ncbi:MAG TPA: hypothetical protein VE130_10135, partial [Nitrososphaeraceae archaeon]|nr:hypothetical protein [Nitrososphaeraceae archaeon]
PSPSLPPPSLEEREQPVHYARAAAAGIATENALRTMGLSDDVTSTAREAVERSVIVSLDRGESSAEAAKSAVAAAADAAEAAGAQSAIAPDTAEGSAEDVARAVAATVGAAAAATVASNSADEAAQAANAAAQAAARGENEQAAEDAALNDGATENVVEVAGTALEIGTDAAQELQIPSSPSSDDGPPSDGSSPVIAWSNSSST